MTLTQIDRAMQMVDQHPQAFGMANLAGDAVRQRDIPLVGDPEGVDARAIVANIAGQKIHDRSGAAVTIGEWNGSSRTFPTSRQRRDGERSSRCSGRSTPGCSRSLRGAAPSPR